MYNGVELPQSAWCGIPFNEQESHGSLYMMLASTLIYFLAPLVIVTLLYSRYALRTICPQWNLILSFLVRIGLTLHRNKMQRCAGSCGGEDGACEAER